MKTRSTLQGTGRRAFIKTSRSLCRAVLLGLCLAWTAGTVSAQQVVARARLGNNTEDIEFIPSGRHANQLVVIDGYDVLALPAMGQQRAAATKLFDVKKLPLAGGGPRGIAYLESERLFVFTDVVLGDRLFFTDENGTDAGIRTLTFPAGVVSLGSESVSYIRRGSAFYPDHLLLVIYADPDYSQRIEVVRRDGVVVAEIVPDAAILEHGFASVTYLRSDRLLIGTFDGLLFLTDLHGQVVAGPAEVDPGESCEGVTQLADGRLVAASYSTGRARYFDANLNRLPQADRDFRIGIGLTRPLGPAWNPSANELLFLGAGTVEAVPVTLNTRRTAVDLAADGLNPYLLRDVTYLPNEERIGVATINPHQIVLYGSNGLREEVIDLSPLGGSTIAQFIPDSQQFVLGLRGRANRGLMKFIERDGTLSGTIDLRPFGVNLACFSYFHPSPLSEGLFLVMDSLNDAMFVIDAHGNLLASYQYRDALGLPMIFGVTAISTGPYAGAFAAVNGDNSEVVIFTLP